VTGTPLGKETENQAPFGLPKAVGILKFFEPTDEPPIPPDRIFAVIGVGTPFPELM
jgi:hypothetical protein